eukprot:2312049-Prymnesium_polylepis.1
MGCGGVTQRARHVSITQAPKLRRYPGEGSAVTPGRVDARTEFCANQPAGDRPEVAGDRTRSSEIDRVPPDLAEIR